MQHVIGTVRNVLAAAAEAQDTLGHWSELPIEHAHPVSYLRARLGLTETEWRVLWVLIAHELCAASRQLVRELNNAPLRDASVDMLRRVAYGGHDTPAWHELGDGGGLQRLGLVEPLDAAARALDALSPRAGARRGGRRGGTPRGGGHIHATGARRDGDPCRARRSARGPREADHHHPVLGRSDPARRSDDGGRRAARADSSSAQVRPRGSRTRSSSVRSIRCSSTATSFCIQRGRGAAHRSSAGRTGALRQASTSSQPRRPASRLQRAGCRTSIRSSAHSASTTSPASARRSAALPPKQRAHSARRPYATGDKVAFASAPDLHTAAHEAAHAVQQRSGVVGFQGLGAADDEHERHADAVADKVVSGESAEPLLDAMIGGVNVATRATSAAVQQKPHGPIETSHWKLAAPNKIDLGDSVVDTRTKHQASIFALHREQGPRIRAALHGDPSVKLLASPLFLPGATAPYADANAFKFEHHPSRKGEVAGTLIVEILDEPHDILRTPIVATAHHAGEPTMAEQHRAHERRETEELEASNAAAERERVEKRIEARYRSDKRYHAGHYAKLEARRKLVEKAIETLYSSRQNGLASANEEIGTFVRQQKVVKPSLLEQLAFLALDMAAAGIAGAIARRLQQALSKVLTITAPKYLPNNPRYPRVERQNTPSESLVTFFTDGFKEGAKKSTKLRSASSNEPDGIPHLGDDVGVLPGGGTYAKQSADPKAEFIAVQSEQLTREGAERAVPMSIFAFESLLSTLDGDPDGALAAMEAIHKAIVDESNDAMAKQREETVRKWVRYLAESSANGPLEGPFDAKHPVPAVDGVIDLAIKPIFRNPEQPVEVIGARVLGVRKAVVDRLAKQPLINLDVPVRASGGFDGSPSATLTVVRESGGTIKHVENVAGDGARWLQRKAIANGLGADAEAGARALIEREIMSQRLYQLLKHGEIENDSKD